MGRCRHRLARVWDWRPMFSTPLVKQLRAGSLRMRPADARLFADAMTCADCGHWLPLGPANDTPETAVEVRAADLVSLHYRSLRGVTFTADELCGWDPSVARAFKLGKARRLDEFEAGLLARVIVDTHKEDDRG